MIKPLFPSKRSEQKSPGPYDGHLKPFGSDNMNKMTFGGKY